MLELCRFTPRNFIDSGPGAAITSFMVIGLLRVRLLLRYTHSLKEKRSIIKRLIHHLRTNNNCAVAETAFQDVWQTAEISIVTVYAEKPMVESLFHKLENELTKGEEFELALQEIEFL